MRQYLIICFHVFAIVYCALGFYHTAKRKTLDNKAFEKSDAVVSIEELSNPSSAEITFLVRKSTLQDSFSVKVERIQDQKAYRVMLDGETQQIVPFVVRDTVVKSFRVGMVQRHSVFYLIGLLLSGVCFVGLAIFVQQYQPSNNIAQLFSVVCMLVGMMIFSGASNFGDNPYSLINSLHLGFLLSYTIVPPLFFKFTTLFPNRPNSERRRIFFSLLFTVLIFIGFGLALKASMSFFEAISETTTLSINRYNESLNACRLYFIIVVGMAGLVFMMSYLNAKEEADRRRLQWMLFGLIFGCLSYMFFSLLPMIIYGKPLIPDEIAVALATLLPISFTIAIVRYRLLDIDLIFNRSFTALAVLFVVAFFYTVLIFLMVKFIPDSESISPYAISAVAALLAVLVADPLRRNIQHIIDTFFFKTQYNWRQAKARITKEIEDSTSETELAEIIVEEIDQLLSVERIAFFRLSEKRNRLIVFAENNFLIPKNRSVPNPTNQDCSLPIALSQLLEEGIDHNQGEKLIFEKWKVGLILPIRSELLLLGYLVVGRKNVQRAFSAEDVSLLETVCSQTAMHTLRLRLQRDLAIKSEEADRLEALSFMKSYFVSSVSHDLRTPLTSIKLFAEMLKERVTDDSSKKYASMIEGESERLSKMISNILSYAKAENGIVAFNLELISLNALILESLTNLRYQIQLGGFDIVTNLSEHNLFINADKHSVIQAIENIIANAMKYSGSSKKIDVASREEHNSAIVSISDTGVGISPDEQTQIFEPFYRSRHELTSQVGGAGLGLSIVKHTMNAHRGQVFVRSNPNFGSTFELHFPLHEASN